MTPSITTQSQIRAILTDGMRDGKWRSLPELYDLVKRGAGLTPADSDPQAPGNPAPRWQRNVRNVLQSGKQGASPIFDWYEPGRLYRLRGVGPGSPSTGDDQLPDSDVENLLRPRRRGRRLNHAQQLAVEQHAVLVATTELRDEGWDVTDVGATRSYDLHCTKPGELPLYVEVKGTTGPLGSVNLTAKEVALARSHYPATALFVVHDIELEGDAQAPAARAGRSHPVRPWTPDEARLRPTAFSYRVLDADGGLGSLS